MILPTKYETLWSNALVIGAHILGILKDKNCNLENLYWEIRKKDKITIEQFYNTVTFLRLSDCVVINDFYIRLNKKQ